MQIDDGIFVRPLPYDDEDQGDGRYQGKDHDEVRFEPIIALALVEDDLQGSQTESDEAEAYVVDFGFAELAALEIGRVLNEPRGQQQRKDADWNIDEENPAPGEVVRDPAAEGWTDGGSAHYCDAVNRKSHAALGGSESVGENGLLAGLETASASTLQHAADDQNSQVRRQSAEKGTDR